MSKIQEANEKITETVVNAYQTIETGVVEGYKKVENAFVGGYKKVEDAFVTTFLAREGETVEEAKARINGANGNEEI